MNFELVAQIASRFDSWAVVGAYALAARGYVRQTADFDLMTADDSALTETTWRDLTSAGIRVEIRKGDFDDPLAGVVRIQAGASSIDVIVAKYKWQKRALDRAQVIALSGIELRIPAVADLILLKLYAGGPGDLHDVARLLDRDDRDEVIAEVEDELASLPKEMRDHWRRALDLS